MRIPSTRTWLVIMLWAIGLGAVIGASAVLLAPHTAIYRVVGTCFLVGGAALAMMFATHLIDREQTRAGGLLGMWLVLIIFFLALGLIWDVDVVLDSAFGTQRWRFSHGMWSTIGWLLLTGVPAAVCLCLIRTDHSRIAGYVGLVVACAAFVLFMTDTWIYVFHQGPPRAYRHLGLSGAWIGGMGLLAAGSLLGPRALFARPWVWIGVIASTGAAVMALYGIWMETSTKLGENLTVALISAAVLVCYANLMVHWPVRPQHKWLPYVTIAAAAATAVAVNVRVIYEPAADSDFHDMMERIIVAGIILTASGTLAAAILARLHRPFAIERSTELIREIVVICPLCRSKQKLHAGEQSACRSCGLRIEVKIAEPRCPECDYLLYHLQSNHCPECGHKLRPANEQSG